MTYFREVLRRHYEHLEREHAKFSEEEAARTRVERQNAAYLADLVELMRTRIDATHGFSAPSDFEMTHANHQ